MSMEDLAIKIKPAAAMEPLHLNESLSDVLRDCSRPVFLFGDVPPRHGTSVEKAKEI